MKPEKPRIEMQGERNKPTSAGNIEFGRLSFRLMFAPRLILLLDKPLS